MRAGIRQPNRTRKPHFCIDCGKPITYQAKRCKKHYLKSKYVINASLNAVERKFQGLPMDLQKVVVRIMERYEMKSVFAKRAILSEAIEVVTAAVNCTGRCCAGQSVSERLAEL